MTAHPEVLMHFVAARAVRRDGPQRRCRRYDRRPQDKSAMSQQDRFEKILAWLQEAAFDDSRWPCVSALIDEALGIKGNILVTGDGASGDDVDIFFARFCYRGQRKEELERRYFESYYALDERIPRVRQLPDGQLVHMASLYTDEEKKTSPAYNEALPIGDTRDGVNVRLDGPDGSRIVWVTADPVDAEGWSTERVETIERFLPHLRHFVRVRHALIDARALGASFAVLLENARYGVIQLDRRGRIVAANDRACDLLRRADGLFDESGLLRAATPRQDAALQKLLARALPRFGGQGTVGAMMITRPAASPRLALHVSPVGGEGSDLRPVRTAAIVLVVDPADRARVDPRVVETTLGLTPAESRVALLLAQGSSIQDIAIGTGRSSGTIRWHIKQIFSKVNVSRQLELVQMVQSLADFPGNRR